MVRLRFIQPCSAVASTRHRRWRFLFLWHHTITIYICTMNLLLRIFAIYFLSLSFLPCGDSNECTETLDNNFSITSLPGHTSHSDHDENCPPLCNCSCCSLHFLEDGQAIKINLQAFANTQTFAEPPFTLSSAGRSIWQPPQLG